MKTQSFCKLVGSVVALGAVVLAALSINPPRAHAQDPRIAIGLQIAPVPLNLAGKDKAKVGFGSYLVNALAQCDGCHNHGLPPNFEYAAGGNPYFSQRAVVDPTEYLAGGYNFGAVGTPTGPNGYAGPAIISRNLTPDKTGLPEGGRTLAEFKQIMRHGTDFDHIHPTCSAKQIAEIKAGKTGIVCIPTGPDNTANGDLLQVMAWPYFSHLTDGDLEAIYEYLRAIPCIDNTFSKAPDGAPNELHNDCGGRASSAVIK
jgi:hypothetical protein